MSAWAGLLSGAHGMIAMMRSEPHWMLNDADAKAYGTALANAIRHLPVAVSQKALDFSAFMMCAIQMDGVRVTRSWQLAREKNAPPPRPRAQVFPFPPAAPIPAGPQTKAPAGVPDDFVQVEIPENAG